MPKVIEVEGLGNVEFPDSMSDDAIAAEIKKQLPQPKEPSLGEQYQKFGEEHPYISGAISLIPGIGAFAPHATDVQSGMAKQVGRDAYNLLEAAGPVGMATHFVAEKTGLGDVIRKGTEASNPSEKFGGLATTAAEMAIPGPKAASKVAELIPNTERAGAKFASVMEAAHDLPINVAVPGDIALETRVMASQGGSLPKVIRDFLTRATDPKQGPVTYKEARGFYSNATRLSADEAQRLTPPMKRQVAMFTKALGESLEQTAAHVDKLHEYSEAMREYHNAMRLKHFWQDIKELATSSAVKAAGAGAAGAYAVKELLNK